MGELVLQNNIVINDVENVIRAISDICGKTAHPEAIMRFITNERSTKFFLDGKLNSYAEPTKDTQYLWIDTGYRDSMDNPVMTGLLREEGSFSGHYTAVPGVLVKKIRQDNPGNSSVINMNYGRFLEKYRKKAAERSNAYISSEDEYLISSLNHDSGSTLMAQLLKNVKIKNEDPEPEVIKDTSLQTEEMPEMSDEEQELTIGILLDKIEDMEKYCSELLTIIEKNEKSSREKIQSLQEKNDEYMQAILRMRSFVDSEDNNAGVEDKCGMGHGLLKRNEKILVIGNADIGNDVMQAIAKRDFGFEKQDIEFITDYAKIRSASHRVHSSARFAAVILGQCPHKVADLGNWTNLINEMKSEDAGCIAVDARTKAGGLKVTKESFRKALYDVCRGLSSDGRIGN